MKIENDHFVMDDGTSYYAHQGIVGLSPHGELTQGYDGAFGPFDHDTLETTFPATHRKEIGEYMVAAWTAWMHAQSAPQSDSA